MSTATPSASVSKTGPEVEHAVRRAVRSILEKSQGFREAPPELRKAIAKKMTHVSLGAAQLLDEDRKLTLEAERKTQPLALAEAMTARHRGGAAAQRSPLQDFAAPAAAGAAVQNLRAALDFPSYVTELINGVFRAITSSTLSQMQSLSDLLDNVSSSVDTFSQRNISQSDASRWAADRFPFLTRDENGGLRMREGADSAAAARTLQQDLGAPRSALDGDDIGESLMPFIQRRMGRDRQAILGTIIQLGIQRVVVDEGRLHASMDMRVDARSLQERTRQNQTGVDFHTAASGNFSMGMWGASANMGLSVTSVHADSEYRKDELTAQAGLRSSVDLAFRTEQIPLDRMAGSTQRARLDSVARVPASVGEGSPLTTGGPTIAPATMTGPTRAEAPTAPTPPGREQRSSDDASQRRSDESAGGEGGGEGGGARGDAAAGGARGDAAAGGARGDAAAGGARGDAAAGAGGRGDAAAGAGGRGNAGAGAGGNAGAGAGGNARGGAGAGGGGRGGGRGGGGGGGARGDAARGDGAGAEG